MYFTDINITYPNNNFTLNSILVLYASGSSKLHINLYTKFLIQ